MDVLGDCESYASPEDHEWESLLFYFMSPKQPFFFRQRLDVRTLYFFTATLK